MSVYLEELEDKGLSLLIYKGDEVIFSSSSVGMKPLLDAIEALGREELRGTIVVDKIVGRAAALLIVYMGAAEVHAALMSAGAKDALSSHDRRFYFAEETAVIMNLHGSDICPFEKLVQEVYEPEEAYMKIRAKVSGF